MIKWSRVKLGLSILTAAGLWQTLRERVGVASSAGAAGKDTDCTLGSTARYDLAGALHVHSTYSDGVGTIDDIAEAAARAGADFVLVSDHSSLIAIEKGEEGWHQGGKVLIVIGAEVTTDTGHLLVMGVPGSHDVTASREALDVQGKAVTSGGYGYIALPCDLKDHWRDFTKRSDYFGIEVFNLSSIARTKISLPGLLLTMRRYFGKRPITAFSYVAGRPHRELSLWDRLTLEAHKTGRPIPNAIGCLDAHAVMKFGGREYPFPTYEEVFRTLRTHVLLTEPPRRTAEGAGRDLEMVNAAMRSGRSYVSYDNYGDPRGFTFQLRSEKEYLADMGECYKKELNKRLFLDICSPAKHSIIRLLCNGQTVAKTRGARLCYEVHEAGVYRVEVANYRWRVGNVCFGTHPWIFSNPIEIR